MRNSWTFSRVGSLTHSLVLCRYYRLADIPIPKDVSLRGLIVFRIPAQQKLTESNIKIPSHASFRLLPASTVVFVNEWGNSFTWIFEASCVSKVRTVICVKPNSTPIEPFSCLRVVESPRIETAVCLSRSGAMAVDLESQDRCGSGSLTRSCFRAQFPPSQLQRSKLPFVQFQLEYPYGGQGRSRELGEVRVIEPDHR